MNERGVSVSQVIQDQIKITDTSIDSDSLSFIELSNWVNKQTRESREDSQFIAGFYYSESHTNIESFLKSCSVFQ